MNNKKLATAIASVFAFTYFVNFLLHNVFLENAYRASLELWRSQAEILGFLHLSLMVHLIFAVIIVQFFRDFVLKKKKPLLHDSLAAGLLVGEMVGLIQLGTYVFMPVTPAVAIGWFTAMVIECIGSAYIIHRVFVGK